MPGPSKSLSDDAHQVILMYKDQSLSKFKSTVAFVSVRTRCCVITYVMGGRVGVNESL